VSNDEQQTQNDPATGDTDNEPVGGGEKITLSHDTAMSFAAEALMDAYDIALDIKDTATMLKIAKMWAGLSQVLGTEDEPHKHEKKINPLGFTVHQDETLLESEVG